ncbi:MAG TPA: hypothetical protein D7I10_04475 [Candidatus Poseidoniales archaeon]|nr:MAG TPA: hypothetical protein D7I10_04475 [Candidatus Poseidoniales archaeon]
MNITNESLLDGLESQLFAQVHSGDPEMKIDQEARLRHANFPGAEGSLFLGDVTDALLRCFGAHEPPRVTELPGFDQQRWVLVVSDPEVSITIESRSYWGMGLLSTCFLNGIKIVGPLKRRARIVFDLAAALGRNPWEAKWKSRFAKNTGVTSTEEKEKWEALIEYGREDLSNTIDSIRTKAESLEQDLPSLADDAPDGWDGDLALEEIGAAYAECEVAKDALHDRSATGVERALARAEAHIIEADPRTEVAAQFEGGDVLEEMASIEADDLDLTDQVLEFEELPEEAIRTQTALSEDEIPFIDLAEEE